MGLKLKHGPKDRIWHPAVIIVPDDDGETHQDEFSVQMRYLLQDERDEFFASQGAAFARLMRKSGRAPEKAEDEQAPDNVPDDFDPGEDLANYWLVKRGVITGFRGLLDADDKEVAVADLPDLLAYPCYRTGLFNLLVQQCRDPRAADRGN